ncbi:MAG: HlyD family secretion protein [Gammaproteobacteria bacterium]|jgi:HlyD family secretion protein
MGSRGWITAIVIVALAGGGWAFSNRGDEGSTQNQAVAAVVLRGDLPISVVERGNLKAANSLELKSEIEGSTTILMLIEEGKFVEEGALLAELDATGMVEKRVSQEITRQNAEASWIKSTQNLEIQKSQNLSDRASAERNLAFAEIDKKKYTEGEWLNQEQKAKDDILLAEEDLTRAIDTLSHSATLFDRGFITRNEYDGDVLAKQRKEISLEQARRTLEVLTTYTNPREIQSLDADVVEANREIERVDLQAKARLVDYEAEVRSALARFELETEKYDRLEDQIAKAKIYAPAGGMVVYAQPEGGRNSSGEPLREGSTVRERQNIVTIPSSEGMVAEVSLHESVLEKVQTGMLCTIKVDALGDLELPGVVKFKAVLPDRNSWMANPNQRLYRTEISITESDPRMRPGMSCSIEINVEVVRDTLYVPVQTIFRDGGESIVFVYTETGGVEKKLVEVGSFSHLWAQIVTGVEEGQRIALSVPAGQTLAPAPQLQNASEDSGEDAKTSGATTGKPSTGGEGGSSAKEGMKKGGRPTGVGGPEKSASSKDKGEATAPKGSALVQADSEAPAEPSGSQK